jgi:putative ABC transport system permease protein
MFTMVVALLAGILFGLAPAKHTLRLDVREALNETERGGASRGISSMRAVLVVAEVAVAALLLVGAGLLLRSFEQLASVSPGFSTDHILIADIPLSPNSHHNPTERLDFYERVIQQTAALPGVSSATASSFLPVSGTGMALYFNIQGRPPKNNDYSLANYRAVSPDYFAALKIPLKQGRLFQASDRENEPTVVIINSTLARTFFPDSSPLGQHLQIGGLPNEVNPWMEIVGVVGDVKQALASEAATELYIPYRQSDKIRPVLSMSLIVHTGSDPLALANSLRRVVHDVDPNQPVVKIRTMDENIADSLSQPRFRTILLTIFAGIALVLAAIGIFSVMAYSVAQRTREIGVRIALGASRRQIFRLILEYSIRLTIIGLVIGMIATLVLTRYVSTFLFHVTSYDPITLIGMAMVIMLIALSASYLPAHRATRIDPITALRQD